MKNIPQVEFERRVSAIVLLPISEDAVCFCPRNEYGCVFANVVIVCFRINILDYSEALEHAST